MPNRSAPKSKEPITSIRSLKTAIAKPSHPLLYTLNIGSKIGIGYGIALGIAILGTVLGSIVGNQIQRRARQQQAIFHDAERLINDLQISLLEVRINEQQLLRLVRYPQASPLQYSTANIQLQEADLLLSNFQATLTQMSNHPELWGQASGVARSLKTELPVASRYLNGLNTLLHQRFSPASQATSQMILDGLEAFTQDSDTQQLEEFSLQLNKLVAIAQQLEDHAEQELIRAEHLRQQILVGSMVLSGLLACFFATYTSRAIARPLREVTHIARQVTEEANFDLRASITSTDEVGILAHSLNKLIQRVKDLLQEQEKALVEQQRLQQEQLLQAEKMSSLGRMLAGVAHEINNPVNFIYGNLNYAREYIHDLIRLIHAYEAAVPTPPPMVTELAEAIDLEFLSQDLPKLLQSMQVGTDRTRQIVLSLKNFSRMDDVTPHAVDLPACLDSTLLILNNRIKRGVTIQRHYNEVPIVQGYSGLLYQVFMNLLSNALDALDEQRENHAQQVDDEQADWVPTIHIHLHRSGPNQVQITIADNGCGIPPERLPCIFDAFYTSKPVGVGTGLGLSISKDLIETKHQGHIQCNSTPGQGTQFVITLPLQSSPQSQRDKVPAADAEQPSYS